jgi:rare lipoprotein A
MMEGSEGPKTIVNGNVWVLRRPSGAIPAVAAAVALLLLAGCAKKPRTPKPARIGKTETGIASWYGHPYHGRRAASGEIYDMEKLTAAHRTLPFDTWVRVRNLGNGKTVEVRINDRGPFVRGRIIDLSRAAARQIGMIGPGTARVRLEVIRPPARRAARDAFGVQVGAFAERANAERLRDEMRRAHGSASIVRREGDRVLWRVMVGNFSSEESAEALAGRLRAAFPDCFVVRIDEAGAN